MNTEKKLHLYVFNQEGLAILLVEQNANMALSISDRDYVLQIGRLMNQK